MYQNLAIRIKKPKTVLVSNYVLRIYISCKTHYPKEGKGRGSKYYLVSVVQTYYIKIF